LLWRARDAHRASPSFVRRALSLPTNPGADAFAVSDGSGPRSITASPGSDRPQNHELLPRELARRGVLRACDLESRRHGSYVLIAGAVVGEAASRDGEGPTFSCPEDETGISNIIIRRTYRLYKRVLDSDAAVVVGGKLQTVDGVISVTAKRLDALAALREDLRPRVAMTPGLTRTRYALLAMDPRRAHR